MVDFFEHLVVAHQSSLATQDMVGRSLSLKIGVCADTSDPLNLGRIKVLDSTKGPQGFSGWLVRGTIYKGLTVPTPNIGEQVVYSFIDGDPHDGVYYCIAQNQANPPAQDLKSITLTLGSVTVKLSSDGSLSITGVTSVSVDTPTLSITSATSVSINNNQILTIGSRDTANKTNITTGWS